MSPPPLSSLHFVCYCGQKKEPSCVEQTISVRRQRWLACMDEAFVEEERLRGWAEQGGGGRVSRLRRCLCVSVRVSSFFHSFFLFLFFSLLFSFAFPTSPPLLVRPRNSTTQYKVKKKKKKKKKNEQKNGPPRRRTQAREREEETWNVARVYENRRATSREAPSEPLCGFVEPSIQVFPSSSPLVSECTCLWVGCR